MSGSVFYAAGPRHPPCRRDCAGPAVLPPAGGGRVYPALPDGRGTEAVAAPQDARGRHPSGDGCLPGATPRGCEPLAPPVRRRQEEAPPQVREQALPHDDHDNPLPRRPDIRRGLPGVFPVCEVQAGRERDVHLCRRYPPTVCHGCAQPGLRYDGRSRQVWQHVRDASPSRCFLQGGGRPHGWEARGRHRTPQRRSSQARQYRSVPCWGYCHCDVAGRYAARGRRGHPACKRDGRPRGSAPAHQPGGRGLLHASGDAHAAGAPPALWSRPHGLQVCVLPGEGRGGRGPLRAVRLPPVRPPAPHRRGVGQIARRGLEEARGYQEQDPITFLPCLSPARSVLWSRQMLYWASEE
mmetsp:Transcript_38410/g.91103  ORF Transcript_38410/g.91103 Transcript_38410/m.91103 type:complete len:352 (+) Transcript_38410:2816-3871(+)